LRIAGLSDAFRRQSKIPSPVERKPKYKASSKSEQDTDARARRAD